MTHAVKKKKKNKRILCSILDFTVLLRLIQKMVEIIFVEYSISFCAKFEVPFLDKKYILIVEIRDNRARRQSVMGHPLFFSIFSYNAPN